jgi:hypothetical protein
VISVIALPTARDAYDLSGRGPLDKLFALELLTIRNGGSSIRVPVGRPPQPLRCVQRIDIEVLPPCAFVATPVKLAMMEPAEWDGEFVAHFAPECPLFSKPKVMRIRRGAPADQTGLDGHEP